jgi:membrane protein required for beta-lactamase induction
MTLITILICIGLEHFFGSLERLRDMSWLQRYADWLHSRLGHVPAWDGSFGLLTTLALPLFLIIGFLGYLYTYAPLLAFVGGVGCLLYTLGPKDLNLQIEAYKKAVASGDDAAITAALAALTGGGENPSDEMRTQATMESVLVAANERYFAVCFWFGVLGPLGALLYRFNAELRRISSARSLAFTETAVRLHAILDWVPSRLFALGFALGGSLTHSLEAWKFRRTLNLFENEGVIKSAGLGALLFDQPEQVLSPEAECTWVDEARGLAARTFLVWFTVLALMTLAGRIA